MQHIGFIMDGNRSWAKERGLPSFQGHRKGYLNAKKLIPEIQKLHIPFTSFWALSDDNIAKRSSEEVGFLFRLLEKGILDIAKDSIKNNIRIVCVGDRNLLTPKCVKNIEKAESLTEKNTGMTVILAIGYGGQEEIARAVSLLASTGQDMTQVKKEDILTHIETGKFPPPDLIIRTGGHVRHSGFFLFLSPYAEYFFSQKNWPDLSISDIKGAIDIFQEAERKFGK